MIVGAVLLHGSDTWVVTKRMQEMLTSFHNRCARHITRRYIRFVEATEGWDTPSTEGVLKEAGLHPIMHYVCARRNSLLSRYLQDRSIFANAVLRPHPHAPDLRTILEPNKLSDNRVMGDQVPLGTRLSQSWTNSLTSSTKKLSILLSDKWEKPYAVVRGYVNARMSIAIVRATHICLRGSRIPTSKMSNRRPQWEDKAGLSLFRNST